jgi:hypothetical protein
LARVLTDPPGVPVPGKGGRCGSLRAGCGTWSTHAGFHLSLMAANAKTIAASASRMRIIRPAVIFICLSACSTQRASPVYSCHDLPLFCLRWAMAENGRSRTPRLLPFLSVTSTHSSLSLRQNKKGHPLCADGPRVAVVSPILPYPPHLSFPMSARILRLLSERSQRTKHASRGFIQR